MGTLSPSHRRSSHETFLAVVAPFMYPFRCSACNWRGMMGRASLVQHSKLNLAVNSTMYFILLILLVSGFVWVRGLMHPV